MRTFLSCKIVGAEVVVFNYANRMPIVAIRIHVNEKKKWFDFECSAFCNRIIHILHLWNILWNQIDIALARTIYLRKYASEFGYLLPTYSIFTMSKILAYASATGIAIDEKELRVSLEKIVAYWKLPLLTLIGKCKSIMQRKIVLLPEFLVVLAKLHSLFGLRSNLSVPFDIFLPINLSPKHTIHL